MVCVRPVVAAARQLAAPALCRVQNGVHGQPDDVVARRRGRRRRSVHAAYTVTTNHDEHVDRYIGIARHHIGTCASTGAGS
jgi:hypothetical protein